MVAISQRIRHLTGELKRRKVFRVAAMYGVIAWLLIQVAETVFPVLHLPEWTVTFVVVAALLGFPLALTLSWLFELRPESATEVPSAPAGTSAPSIAVVADEPQATPTARPTVSHPFTLPVQPTPFVGRSRELASVRQMLADPDCRIVTVSGPGGIGKTRFSLRAAEEAANGFEHGAAFVPLNALTDASPLVATVAERLGLPLTGRVDARDELLAFLRDLSLLLVLDNFEHLVASAGFLADLTQNAPRLKVLVTSRERLGLYGERLFPLDGLAVSERGGDEADLEKSDAVRLFLQSARRVVPDFDPGIAELRTIARICRAVNGIPLAIELAAAWVRVLSCDEILREIGQDGDFLAESRRGDGDRQRSLRSVFESTWRLLSDAERRVYRRLTVFRGGFEADAAKEVAGATAAMLSVLIDKSLVRRSPSGRFEILEVLRQHGESKLREDDEEFIRVADNHAAHFVTRLEHARSGLGAAAEKETLDRIAEEIENVRAAWHWAAEHRHAARIERALDGVFAFHEVRGRVQEGSELLDQALSRLETAPAEVGAERTILRLKVRKALFDALLGGSIAACERIDVAIARLRGMEDPQELAFALDRRGVLALELGDYPVARRLFEESNQIASAAGDGRRIGSTLIHLGSAALMAGEYAEAERLYREALTRLDAVGDRRGMAKCHRNRGVIAGMQGDHALARRSFQAGLAIDRELGNVSGVSTSLQNLGYLAFLAGDYDEAERDLREGVETCQSTGNRRLLAFCLNGLGDVETARGRHVEARDRYRQALSTAAGIGDAPLLLEVLTGVARSLGIHGGRPERAMQLVRLVLGHPASDQDTRTRAEALFAELTANSPTASTGAPPPDEPPLSLDDAVAGILHDDLAANSLADEQEVAHR
jgi:predicted ATPase/Flp pilus assembly protein TadD